MNNSKTPPLSEIRNWDLSKIEAVIIKALQSGSVAEEAYFTVGRADLFFRKGETDKAEKDTHRAIHLATEIGDNQVLGIALGLQASIYSLRGDGKAAQYFIRAIELLHETQSLLDEGRVRAMYANLLSLRGLPGEALVQYENARDCYDRAGHSDLGIGPYIGIGCVYFNMGELQRAIDSWKETAALARKYSQDDHLFTSLYDIAAAYIELEEWDLVETFTKEAFTIASERNFPGELAFCYQTFAAVQESRGNYDQAIQEFERSRTLLLQMDDKINAAGVKTAVGTCLLRAGRIQEAIEELKGSVEELLVSTDKNKLLKAYEFLVEAYHLKEDYRYAFEYYQKQSQLKDEIFSSDFKSQLLTLERKLTQERTEAAAKLFQAQAHQLEEQLRLQATAHATQTEMLSNFRDDLRMIVKHSYDPVNALKKVNEQLKTLQVPKLGWAKLEKEFIILHPEFRRTLQQQFPELTNQELRLCQLLRTGLKSIDAARLMSVSERGVEQHRLRIRRKLGLKGKENLAEFLSKL